MAEFKGEPHPRRTWCGSQGKTADIRYRGEFLEVACVGPGKVNASVLSVEQLANLSTIAGFAVGIGKSQPEKNGQYGRFAMESVEVALMVYGGEHTQGLSWLSEIGEIIGCPRRRFTCQEDLPPTRGVVEGTSPRPRRSTRC